MTTAILEWLMTIKQRFVAHTGRVLEIGSLNVNGTPRSVFHDAKKYVGVDMQFGPDVDVVADAHILQLVDMFDLVICCEMLEHDKNPFATLQTLHNHLCESGLLVITTPASGFPEHKYPRDYWRFMPDTYRDIFFNGMEMLELVEIAGPTLCGVGR